MTKNNPPPEQEEFDYINQDLILHTNVMCEFVQSMTSAFEGDKNDKGYFNVLEEIIKIFRYEAKRFEGYYAAFMDTTSTSKRLDKVSDAKMKVALSTLYRDLRRKVQDDKKKVKEFENMVRKLRKKPNNELKARIMGASG